eukprot:g28385.t1
MSRSNTRNKEAKAAMAQELAAVKGRPWVAELESELQVTKAAAEKTALSKSESESNLKEAVDNLELSKAKASQLKSQLKATLQELESVKAQRDVLKMRSGAGYPHRSLSESSSSPAPASKYSKKYIVRKMQTRKTRAKRIVVQRQRTSQVCEPCTQLQAQKGGPRSSLRLKLDFNFSYNSGSRRFGMKL